MMTSLIAAIVLLQSSLDERAVLAAERAAAAAEKAALAAESAVRAAATTATPAAATAEASSSKPSAASAWTGNAGLGLIMLSGNANSITVSATAGVQRKTELWILNLKAFGAFGQQTGSAAGASPVVVAYNAGLEAQGDWRFNSWVSAFVGGGVDTDHVKSVEIRGFGQGGIGLMWLDEKEKDLQKILLRTDLSLRYSRENRFQYYPNMLDQPDVDLLAPRFAATFRYALNAGVVFQQEAEVLPNILGGGRFLINTLTKVSAQLIDHLSIGTSFAVKHDSQPAPGRISTDTALLVGIEASL